MCHWTVAPNIGHAGAASGLAAIVKTCLCLYQEIIPPLKNFQQPDLPAGKKGPFIYLPSLNTGQEIARTDLE
jgi:3-oxoacyl-(acyl-carrier-protein) synthase